MNHLGTMYATKRRRRNSKSVRVPPKDGQTKSNPSKRHRERLNAELDTLASLLPYEPNVLSKLDKLSILRLSVSYLRTKSYFQCAMNRDKDRTGTDHHHKSRDILYPESLMEGDLILQALNGFLLILTCEGEVFYASHTVETYLGFHQSDICHQSVYELVHSEDREDLQRHLMWNSHLPSDRSGISLQEGLLPENANILERNFTVRFRCLLDNTSGFLRLDIRGRIKVLQGQNHKTEEPPMALFAVCTPFGPPSLLEMPQKDSMFKSKHKLDLTLVSMDQRGKQLLGYVDSEMSNKSGYDLVHFDDLAYVASAHQELLKTGASGLIAYRLVTKEIKWQWLQTSARLVYKNSKPDFILCTHRPLMEEEGRDLLGKRTMDFKVTYLDGGMGAVTDRSGLLSDSDFIMRCQRNRRYKSQIRDILACRTKRPKTSSTGSETYLEDPTSTNAYNNVYSYSTDNMNGLAPYATATVPQNLFSAAIDNSRFLSPDFLHYRHLAAAGAGYYPDYTHHAAAQYAGNGFLDMTSAAAARTCFTTYQDPGSTHHQLQSKDDKLYSCQLDTSKFNGDPTARLVSQVGMSPVTKPSCCEAYDPNLRGCLMSASSAGIQPLLAQSLSGSLGGPLSGGVDREPPKLAEIGCRNLNFGHHLTPMHHGHTSVSSPHHPSLHCPSVSSDCVIKPKTTQSGRDIMSIHLSKEHKGLGVCANEGSPNHHGGHHSSIGSAFSNDPPRQSVLMWGSNSISRSNSSGSMGTPNNGMGNGANVHQAVSSILSGKYGSNSSLVSSSGTDVIISSPGNNNNNSGGSKSLSSGELTGSMATNACKWGSHAATPKSLSPQSSTSPASGKVAPAVTSYAPTYTADILAEVRGHYMPFSMSSMNEGWHHVETLSAWRPHLPPLG